MSERPDQFEAFLALHRSGTPLLIPNAWDQGSAILLASLDFEALATTSSGFAATLGRLDGSVTRDEALDHAAEIAGAADVPVSADLEDAFAASPDGVAETIRLAAATGLAGCSVEDFTREFDVALAAGEARRAPEGRFERGAAEGPARTDEEARR